MSALAPQRPARRCRACGCRLECDGQEHLCEPHPKRRRPTRRDLLIIVGRLQSLISEGRSAYGNDRDPERYDHTVDPLDVALNLCIAARAFDAPLDNPKSTGGWGEPRG